MTKEELKTLTLETATKAINDLHRLGLDSLVKKDKQGGVKVIKYWYDLYKRLSNSKQ